MYEAEINTSALLFHNSMQTWLQMISAQDGTAQSPGRLSLGFKGNSCSVLVLCTLIGRLFDRHTDITMLL